MTALNTLDFYSIGATSTRKSDFTMAGIPATRSVAEPLRTQALSPHDLRRRRRARLPIIFSASFLARDTLPPDNQQEAASCASVACPGPTVLEETLLDFVVCGDQRKRADPSS